MSRRWPKTKNSAKICPTCGHMMVRDGKRTVIRDGRVTKYQGYWCKHCICFVYPTYPSDAPLSPQAEGVEE